MSIASLNIKIGADVGAAVAGIQTVAQSVEAMTQAMDRTPASFRAIQRAEEHFEALGQTVRRSAVVVATDFIRGCREGVENVIQFGLEAEQAAKRIATLTGQVIDFAAHHLPMSDGIRLGLVGIGAALGTITKVGLMLSVLAVGTAIMKGMTIQAAFAAVSINYLANGIVILAAKVALLSGIPMLMAFAITAEMADRKIAALNGTLTPLQRALEMVAEAWTKWSQIIGGGILDGVAPVLGLIAAGFIALADVVNAANAATGGWLVTGLKVTGMCMTLYSVLMVVNYAWTMMKGLAIFQPIIAGINTLITALQSLFVAQTATNTAQATYNKLSIQSVFVSLLSKIATTFTMIAGATWACAVATSKWILAQLGLNAAMMANPILLPLALIAAAISAIVAGITLMWTWWNSSANAATKTAEKTKMLQNATEAYKNSLRDTVEEHKKMLGVMDKIREAALTPAQKAANRATELQNVIDEPRRLQEQVNRLQTEIATRKKLIANQTDKDTIASLNERNEAAMKTLKDLQDMQSKLKPLTQVEIAAQQTANRKAFAQDMGFDTAQRLDNTAALEAKIEALKTIIATNDQRNQMTIKETDNAIKNMVADYRKAEGIDKIVEPFRTAGDILEADNTKLKQWLDLGAINAGEYANGLKRAAESFKKSSGVDKFLDVSNTLVARQAALDQQFAALEDLHRRKMITEEQLIGAQQKAAEAMLAQSESGKLIQDAMEALRPASDKLNDMIASIEAEAAAARANGMTITEDVLEKAKRLAEEKIMGKSGADGAEKATGNRDNQALVRGSVAYTDFLRQDAGKDHLKDIRNNSKRQVELAEQQVKATEELGGSFDKCFEVVG
jgi:hypothetical protein